MLKIENENKIGIFLDHRQLINDAYNNHNEDPAIKYELKAELFYFHQKPVSTQLLETTESKQNKSRKRKYANNKDIPLDVQFNTELQQLQTKCDIYLPILKSKIQETNFNAIEKQFSRYWEQSYTLPKLHGSNNTNDFKKFKLNNASETYLIPPNCTFYNYEVQLMAELVPRLNLYDLIVLDPPWRNKYIRRLKRAKQELGYNMLRNSELLEMPIAKLIHERSIVAIWCTNSQQHQTALLNEFLPNWNLRLLNILKWCKLNTSGDLISPLNAAGQKQPYETLFITCHKATNDFAHLQKVELLFSVPSIVHSHKPPLLNWLREFLPEQPLCLEIFARYLQPSFTSIGLEVLKLMDERLFEVKNS